MSMEPVIYFNLHLLLAVAYLGGGRTGSILGAEFFSLFALVALVFCALVLKNFKFVIIFIPNLLSETMIRFFSLLFVKFIQLFLF